ncbi:hypothetical protein V8D89_002284 [Ganoderma adspersum]
MQATFATWTPEKGCKVDDYAHLASGFSTLVSSFPAHKRPSFIDSHDNALHFPFSAFVHKHHDTFSDLAVSFPGKHLAEEIHLKLSSISMIMMAKAERDDDPFKHRLKHCKTLVQLAVHARNLMLAHGLACAFVLGIYGDVLRICRFDHSGAVVSQPINIKDIEGVTIVQQFFWHFVHPAEDVPFVGWDPTIRKLTSEDQTWMKARLDLANFDIAGVIAWTEARRAEVYDDNAGDGPVEPQAYVLFKAVDVNGRLFSRATTVWYGICDTRISVDDRHLVDAPGAVSADDLRVRIIKDAWRQLVRRPENEFYRRLAIIPPSERVGLPSIVCGGDLGEKEVRDWESALYGTPTPTPLSDVQHQTRLFPPASPLSSFSFPPASLSASTSSLQLPVHRPMQQTFTWRQARGAKDWHRERSHMRFVMGEVGRPITQFKSTKELATAFRDALIGHRDAMRRGGILHRDISMGNILIVDDPEEHERFCGFIHDFDYSSMTRSAPEGNIPLSSATSLLNADDVDGQLKERTGTFLFMSDELLDSPDPVVHDVRHDIHAFYWVLLWVLLRHTAHNMPRRKGAHPYEACARVFKLGAREEDAADAKRAWFFESRFLVVTGNGALTALMQEFGALVSASALEPENPRALEHDAVLDVFDRALARRDWPTSDDHPVCCTPSPTKEDVGGWLFERRSHGAHARGDDARIRLPVNGPAAGTGKEVSIVRSELDSDEIAEDEIDEEYESDQCGQPEASPDGDMQNAEVPSDGGHYPPYSGGDRDTEWEDAAEVSALIGYGEDEDVLMESLDIEDDDCDLLILLEHINVGSPKATT